MKYILVFSVLLICFACNNQQQPKEVKAKEVAVQKPYYLDTARALQKQIFEYVEKGDMKILTKKEVKKMADPLQAKLDSLRKYVLTPDQIGFLDSYAARLVNEMVDRKVVREMK